MKFYMILFLCSICFMGCKRTELDRKLTGVWAMDLWSIDINAETIEGSEWEGVLGNLLSFESDFTCRMPRFKNIAANDYYDSCGTWQSSSFNGQDSLIIDVNNHPMSGRYKIEFYRDTEKELLKIRLSNSGVEFTCAKFLQNPDRVRNW